MRLSIESDYLADGPTTPCGGCGSYADYCPCDVAWAEAMERQAVYTRHTIRTRAAQYDDAMAHAALRRYGYER